MSVIATSADILAGILGVTFLAGGGVKLGGARMARDNFPHWRYSSGFRVFTGVWETGGAALLLVGIHVHVLGLAGAALILASMSGALYTHTIRVPEMKPLVPVLVLLSAAATTALLMVASL